MREARNRFNTIGYIITEPPHEVPDAMFVAYHSTGTLKHIYYRCRRS